VSERRTHARQANGCAQYEQGGALIRQHSGYTGKFHEISLINLYGWTARV
jgi:hypothetical protein